MNLCFSMTTTHQYINFKRSFRIKSYEKARGKFYIHKHIDRWRDEEKRKGKKKHEAVSENNIRRIRTRRENGKFIHTTQHPTQKSQGFLCFGRHVYTREQERVKEQENKSFLFLAVDFLKLHKSCLFPSRMSSSASFSN